MKIKDLIIRLQEFNPDSEIGIRNYSSLMDIKLKEYHWNKFSDSEEYKGVSCSLADGFPGNIKESSNCVIAIDALNRIDVY